jgi:hypothetical protein
MTQAFKAYYRQSTDKLNLVNTVMLESTKAAYQATVADVVSRLNRSQEILNIGAGEVVTGVSTWNEAMHDAVRDMARNGLTGFVDHAGRRWSPEAYAAMDIRSTMFNTARAAVWERAEEYGADIYQVSSHNGARPLCYPWQGKLISRSGWTGEVEDIDGNIAHVYAESETSKGEPAGLFGINCRHYPMPFIPKFSALRYKGQDEEDNERTYAESQEQRGLERKLRGERLELELLKAQGASPDAIQAQERRVDKASDDIDRFCDETGRARRRSREYTPINADWPDKTTYDAAEFPTAVRDEINDFFRNNDDNNPPPPQVPPQVPPQTPPASPPPQVEAQTPAEPAFTPAETIEEAEKFAERFTDSNRWGAVGVSYKGISLEVANEVNRTVSAFYDTYNIDKFGGVVAPAGNTKLGKLVSNSTAGYMPMRHCIVLNRANMKTIAIAEQGLQEEQSILDRYFANPQGWKFRTERAKRVVEASRQSGRATVPRNIEEVLWHELGHALEKPLRGVQNYDKIKSNYQQWAGKISGYATADFDEYIAESFCAMNKGETIEPELSAGFGALRR